MNEIVATTLNVAETIADAANAIPFLEVTASIPAITITDLGTRHPFADEAGASIDADASFGVVVVDGGDDAPCALVAPSAYVTLPIHPAASLIPGMGDEEYCALVLDLRLRGLVHPIVTLDGMILDGRARYRACQEAGVEPHFAALPEGTNAVAHVVSANIMRRHLTVDQRAALAVELLPALETEAAQRQLAAIGQADAGEKLGKAGKAGRSRDQAAAMFGISGRTVQTAKTIAAADPGLHAGMLAGTVKLAEARRQVAVRERAAGRRDPGALPEGKFDLILADPAWRYEAGTLSTSRQIETHYPTMGMEELRAMADDVIARSADNAVLLMWATAPLLREALDLVEAWRYSYQTSMVWIKDRIGTGYWCRNQHEILLVATRGNPAHPETAVRPPSVFHAPRGEHSAKPIEVVEAMEAAFPHARKLEMFARGEARPGWAVWGNEAIPAPSEGQGEAEQAEEVA